jgi:cell division septal protein FtsQ
MVALGVVQMLTELTGSEYFRVRNLAVTRASDSLRSRLQARMQNLVGARLFDIDLSELTRRLEEDPWVRHAIIKRWLPGTLQVTVQERAPVAWGTFRGRRVLIDTEGWPIEDVPSRMGSMPTLKGIRAQKKEDFARHAAAGLQALAHVRRSAPELLSNLSHIDLSTPGAVVRHRGTSPRQVWLNREDAGRNLSSYIHYQNEIAHYFGPLAAVDLRWRDQIALKPWKSGGSLE